MAVKNRIIEGHFQDVEGNPLANGYLIMHLSQDAQARTELGQVSAGIKIKVPLDVNGNVSGTVLVWPNDALNPDGTYYIVNGYTSEGQLAWGPFYGLVDSSPSPFDLDAWVPVAINTTGGSGTGGTGTVTSVGLTMPGEYSVAGSPITTAGSFAVTKVNQNANLVYAGPATGSPAQPGFRALVSADIPAITPTPLFTTAGQGYFPSWVSLDGQPGTSGAQWTGTNPAVANQIIAYDLMLDVGYTIRKVTALMSSLNAGSVVCAIYDYAGTTKLLDAGTSAFNAGSAAVQSVTLSSPVTLAAGVYKVAFGCTNNATSGDNGITITSSYLSVMNKNATRIATAANAVVAGAMPATLGVLTALPATVVIPGVLFEV